MLPEALFLRPWLGQDPFSPADRKRFAAGRRAKDPFLRGVALSALGDYDGAFAALSEAQAYPRQAGLRARAESAAARPVETPAPTCGCRRGRTEEPLASCLERLAALKQGDVKGAAVLAGSVARLAPRSSAGPVMRALMEAEAGKPRQALACLRKARALDGAPWLRALSARLKARWGDLEGACADLAGVASERLERARLLYRLDRYDQALSELARAAKDAPGDHYIPLLSAEIHSALDRFDLVARDCAKAAALNPRDHWPLVRRSHAWLSMGRLAAAQRDLEAACALAPQDAALRHRLFQAMLLSGDEAGLKDSLRRPGLSARRDHWTACLLMRRGADEAAQLFASCAGEGSEPARHECSLGGARPGGRRAVLRRPGPRRTRLPQDRRATVATLRALRGAEARRLQHARRAGQNLLALFPEVRLRLPRHRG